MESFLRHTAQSILRTIDWKQLQHTTLVLPSHRAGVVLREELLRLQHEQHAQAVWAPHVRTLTQLQDALSPFYAEDELFTIVRLYKFYAALSSQYSADELMPLDLFYGWGRQMVADFTNIDASMPAEEVPNFFANTVAAHELSTWEIDDEIRERLISLVSGNRLAESRNEKSIRAQYELIWQQLYELYKALRTEMESERKGYPGMRQRAVIEHWNDESIQSQIRNRTFIFVGFNYLLPVERELMEKLRDANQALFYWDYKDDFPANEKAFQFAKRNAEILGNNGERLAVSGERKPVTVIECASKEAQAQYVHQWLLDNYTAEGQKVGVVICDESMLEPVVYALPGITLPGATETAPVNITKGFPLRNTDVFARVMTWLNDPARGKSDEIVTPQIIDALLSSIVSADSDEHTDSGLQWQELLILESEYQVRKVANQMRQLITKGLGNVPFTLKLLRLLMRRTMESVTMPFHGEPVTDIQVMGVLETRMLDFDRLLLLNVEEGIIPQKQKDNSFIPYYLRKTYHMQTSDERATVYAYNFFRLLSRTDEATLLYASPAASDSGKGMSRFIMQLIYSPHFEVVRKTLQESNTLQPALFEDHFSDTDESLLSRLTKNEQGEWIRKDGKRYRISPSALNTFISCKRSFRLQYILGLDTYEEEKGAFAPNTMGSFVHHMMEYIYRTYLGCDGETPTRVLPEAIEAVRTSDAKLYEALRAAYETMNSDPRNKQMYILEQHVPENIEILDYVSHILERDREDAKIGLQVCMLEQDHMFRVSLPQGGTVLTGGKIDRSDIFGPEGQERLRIVDYKSGGYNDTTHEKRMSATKEDWMESSDKSYVRQTLIYCHAVNEHRLAIEPHLYFCRRRLTDIPTTIDIEGQTVHDYSAVKNDFYPALCAKIEQVLTTTEFTPCEPDKCPSYCPFFRLCGRKPPEY